MVSENQLTLRVNTRIFFNFLVDLILSFIIVIRNFFFLIFIPYKTVRKISLEKDYFQPVIIFFLVFIYFKFIYFLRDKPYPASLIFLVFLITFFATISFFYFLNKSEDKKITYRSFVFTFSYSLIPTIIWFLTNSVLYVILPPPRTTSILGSSFSIIFFAYSVSLLCWKLILVYLALRFAGKASFYRIIYMMIIYLVWFLPYSIFLYHLKLFRVPFI